MIRQKITEIAEILGWSVDFSEPQNGKTDVNFAKYTSYGQDFNFSVELEDDDMEAFIDNIHEYYENFDVDEEAYIWIGSDGHGKNGAPYHKSHQRATQAEVQGRFRATARPLQDIQHHPTHRG